MRIPSNRERDAAVSMIDVLVSLIERTTAQIKETGALEVPVELLTALAIAKELQKQLQQTDVVARWDWRLILDATKFVAEVAAKVHSLLNCQQGCSTSYEQGRVHHQDTASRRGPFAVGISAQAGRFPHVPVQH